MSAYGLVYDYANKGLVEVVQDFLAESGIDPSQVAFTYRNAITGEQFAMNDLQPMTAGSTYKLPLNMLVVDEVAKGKLNLTDRFDITNTYYEYVGEHDNYVAAFDGAMSIPDMQRYSLVYSENTPAYALADRLGGWSKRVSCSVAMVNLVHQRLKPLMKIIKRQRIITSMSWNIFGIIKKNMRIY